MKHPPSSVLRQAAVWMARLSAEDASQTDYQDFEAWRTGHVQHEAAWQQLLRLQSNFDNLAAQGAGSRLLDRRGISRRQLLTWGGIGLGALSLAGTLQTPHWQSVSADYRTAAGQTQTLQLRSGAEVTLNTRTRLDLDTNNLQMRLTLYAGELLVDNRLTQGEPLSVYTPDGHIRLSGARCAIRCTDQVTRVSVFEGEVAFQSNRLSTDTRLPPGKRAVFDSLHTQLIDSSSPADIAWSWGQLVAEQLPVDQFIAELARYRQGVLVADNALARLSVTGVFPTTDTDQALQQLTQILPVRVNSLTRYWTRVVPA